MESDDRYQQHQAGKMGNDCDGSGKSILWKQTGNVLQNFIKSQGAGTFR